MQRAGVVAGLTGLLLFASNPVRGQGAQPAGKLETGQGQDQSTRAKLSGIVLDSSGRVLQQVKLSLTRDGAPRPLPGQTAPWNTQSAADGKFNFDSVEPGRYVLNADKTGFFKQVYGESNSSGGIVLTLHPGEELKDIRFPLTSIEEAAAISGRVLDENGDPVRGAQVGLTKESYSAYGFSHLQGVMGAATDSLGVFRITAIPAANYYLSVNSRGLPNPEASGTRYRTVYYGGGTSAGGAKKIQIRNGDRLQGFEIRLSTTPVVALSGRVTGDPLPKTIALRNRDADSVVGDSQSNVTPDGSFRFQVSPGSYTLFSSDANRTGQVDVELGPNGLADVVLPLRPGPEVSGRIVIAGDTPASKAAVSGITLYLWTRTSSMGAAVTGKGVPISVAGTFSMTGLDFAQYRLDPNPPPPPGTYIASARLGDREVLYTDIDLTKGSPSDPLVVTFASSRGEITGVVKTPAGSPLAGAIVTLIPEPPRSERRDFTRRAGTDQHGEFAFQGVAPGEYRVYVWTSLEMNAELNADFLKPHRERSTPVTVTDSSTQKLELILDPARR